MATRLPTATRSSACDAVVDLADVGSAEAAGLLRIYSGSQPASANDAASGDLLAEVELDNPAFTAASAGVATLLGTPLSAVGVDAGTAGWFRIVDRDDDTVLDGAAGLSGSGAELIMSTLTVSIGVTVEITSGTVTVPAA